MHLPVQDFDFLDQEGDPESAHCLEAPPSFLILDMDCQECGCHCYQVDGQPQLLMLLMVDELDDQQQDKNSLADLFADPQPILSFDPVYRSNGDAQGCKAEQQDDVGPVCASRLPYLIHCFLAALLFLA